MAYTACLYTNADLPLAGFLNGQFHKFEFARRCDGERLIGFTHHCLYAFHEVESDLSVGAAPSRMHRQKE